MLVLNYHFGVKFKMDTIQISLISVYTNCNQVDMLGLGLNGSSLYQIYLLALCFCISEFLDRN